MLETYLTEWLSFLLRWMHVMVGIIWIGTSFFFVWLNQVCNKIAENTSENNIQNSIWAIHGGGLYKFIAYKTAPDPMPRSIRWFKWEAYATWVSGICLLFVTYYFQADVYLINPNLSTLSNWQAIGIGLATLLVGWFVYDFICQTSLISNAAIFSVVILIIIATLTLGLSNVFSGRGVFIHIGALMGTLMAGNVFRVIIPTQKDMLKNIKNGEQWHSKFMEHAKMRSMHNSYMTFPMLFFMLSNHYPAIHDHPNNWIILICLILIFAFSRYYFILKLRGANRPIILVIAMSAFLMLAMVTTLTKPPATARLSSFDTNHVITPTNVAAIIYQRCNSCHSLNTTDNSFKLPPKEIIFDTLTQIKQHSKQIKRVAIDSNFMPPANRTGMTLAERRILAIWINRGALID